MHTITPLMFMGWFTVLVHTDTSRSLSEDSGTESIECDICSTSSSYPPTDTDDTSEELPVFAIALIAVGGGLCVGCILYRLYVLYVTRQLQLQLKSKLTNRMKQTRKRRRTTWNV